jgi:rhodanese-related sulfurtransferase
VISVLSRAGLADFYNVIGGMTAWQKGGYSTVRRPSA